MPKRLLPREDLIKLPGCDRKCRREPCCTPQICVQTEGFFKPGEMETFSERERKEMAERWDKKTGYWRANSCALPRRLRSADCLAYDCRYVPERVAH